MRAGLDVFERTAGARAAGIAAAEAAGRPRPRARLEHVQMVDAADIPRFGALDVVASVQPVHLESDVLTARERLGESRANAAYPYRRLLDAGAPLAFGTDFPIEALDPRIGLAATATRRSRRHPELAALGADQALDLGAALSAYARGAAEAAGEPGKTGQLRAGAPADIVVLGDDLEDMDPDDWPEAPITATVVDGQVAYGR